MDTDELNRLIRELNDGEPRAAPPESVLASDEPPGAHTTTLAKEDDGAAMLQSLLAEVVRRGGTDLLLVPGAPPTVRIHGRLEPLDGAIVSPDEAARLLLPSLSRERRRRFDDGGAVDLSLSVGALGRFRVNLHRTRRGSAAALRLLPKNVPTLSELGLPPSVEALARLHRGLVLVTGPTGSGKSTSLAALVAAINRSEKRHVVTIEDPVEYEHAHRLSIVEQIEVGSDAASFADALVAALRQDPDVILVGEMRDLDTIRTALTAAETGHLVLTTLHTNDAAQSIHRIVDVFPSDQQPQVRQQLSMALAAIVYQQLIPKKGTAGRALAAEVLLVNDAVRNHIRKGTLHQLHTEMTLGRRLGMQTLEDSLASLVRAGTIAEDEARLRAIHGDELTSLLRG